MKTIVEVCCGSAEDAIQAYVGGADRVELCSNLFQGGLTPSLGSFLAVRDCCDIPMMVMIRPREGGFCYIDSEWETAKHDAKLFAKYGANGLVGGFLDPEGRIDIERTKEFVDLAGELPVTFHRAIDVVKDWKTAIDQLAEAGVARVLTSGQAASVYFGLERVKEMQDYANGRLIIMPGAGISVDNADEVVAKTEAKEIHIAFKKTLYDNSTANNQAIFYGGALYPPEDRYSVTDATKVSLVTGQNRELK